MSRIFFLSVPKQRCMHNQNGSITWHKSYHTMFLLALQDSSMLEIYSGFIFNMRQQMCALNILIQDKFPRLSSTKRPQTGSIMRSIQKNDARIFNISWIDFMINGTMMNFGRTTPEGISILNNMTQIMLQMIQVDEGPKLFYLLAVMLLHFSSLACCMQ